MYCCCVRWQRSFSLRVFSGLPRTNPPYQFCNACRTPKCVTRFSFLTNTVASQLDMLELIDLMDSRLEGRTRIISIHEARNKFPSLQVPTRLPEGFGLSSVAIDEKRQENDRRAPYLPCSVTLKIHVQRTP